MRVRRLRLDLDCAHRRVESTGDRLWTFQILDDGLVLKPNGSVAWILYRQAWDFSETYEVWKSDASDHDGLLAAGPDIDPDALALDGSTIFWIRAGEPQSATLN
jgi:hypothetical protein